MVTEQLATRLREAGATPGQTRLVLRAWTRGLALDAFARRPHALLPARLRAELPGIGAELAGLVQVRSRHPARDGSTRLLLALADGQSIESVLLPPQGVCISTQVGCAVGCVFCMTGRDGVVRQVGSAEIVAQVALARSLGEIRRVVFMGMGEPAHNLDNVLEAIELLGTEGGIAHKNLVFSTVGDPRVFERLPQGRVRPALALSLHTTRAELRAKLLPRAPRIAPEKLVELAEQYARATTYPTQYQWTLLEGVNDSDEELTRIAELLRGKYAVMNFIPYNSVEGLDFRRPPFERAGEMVRFLKRHGVLAKLRRSAGQDVDAGCGQLRARALPAPA
jgi:23S rRNA (adenine2503-C2)-methyltransferase